MLEIKAVKRVTVTEQIMEQIAGLITSGQILPGDKLPNERDLAEQFQVTRGRVREALRALSLVGLITIKAGEGSFVNERQVPIPSETIIWMFHSEIHNLDEVYAARKLIESEVYMSATAHATEEGIDRLQQFLTQMGEALNNHTSEHFLDLLDQFDLCMGEICGNRIYGKLMQTIVHLRRETSLKLLNVPGAMESSAQMRSALLQALIAKDEKKARQAVNAFFRDSQKFYDRLVT
ncbi:FadR/GntR family transcriptional regulator [Paenibacillus sp. PAMC21692]|uniref:FadR/GntR family transcriptional regulator n=1 Tax=Paenibacillus sp. PAMC21692 TaxID=2762320 RepID=UPI00164E2D1D|nr:FCD domain-containing protein [Paenibacillus sp. PAMC21692]QNK55289.1 FadR family transcriptional regulator [Paenibacillus sp. PAMC21692]